MNKLSHNTVNKRNIAKFIALLYDDKHQITAYIKEMMLKRLIWAVTENDDDGISKKYNGHPYWSEAALRKVLSNKENRIPKFKDLRHEHTVPKSEIISRITNSDKSEQTIFTILDNLGYAVIISKEEDIRLNQKKLRSRMPDSFIDDGTVENIFSRYIEAGIKVFDVRPLGDLTKLSREKFDLDFQKCLLLV